MGLHKEQTLSCLSPCLQASHWWLNQSFSTIFAKLLYLKQASDRDDRAKAVLAFAIIGRVLPRAHSYLSAWWNLVSHVKLKLLLSYLKNTKKKSGPHKTFYFIKFSRPDTATSAQQDTKSQPLSLAPSAHLFLLPGKCLQVWTFTYENVNVDIFFPKSLKTKKSYPFACPKWPLLRGLNIIPKATKKANWKLFFKWLFWCLWFFSIWNSWFSHPSLSQRSGKTHQSD